VVKINKHFCEHCKEQITSGKVFITRLDGKPKYFHINKRTEEMTDCFTQYVMDRGAIVILERGALVLGHSMDFSEIVTPDETER